MTRPPQDRKSFHKGPRRPGGKPAPKRDDRPKPPPDPRRAALILLNGVLEDHKLLPEMMGPKGPLARLDAPARARAQRLATETLRHMGALDAMIAQHVAHLPPLPVLNVMRMASYELCSGEAAHGVVNSAVNQIAAMARHNRAKGMANAVLRKIAAAPVPPDALPPDRLPDWLRPALVQAWGESAIAGCETAHAKGAPLDLTPRDPASAATLAGTLGATHLPSGSVRVAGPVQVSALPGYEQGEWWVQDAAAAIPARLLNVKPGEKVLDLCAAPGGKTLQLATAGARVTALDISVSRLRRVEENLARTGLTARLITGDALEFTESGWDAILIDAPCSATGTIRRHPDLPQAKDGSDFAALFDLQASILDHALTLLKPGGRLCFCTCSLLPDEGEVQVEEALLRHPGLATDRDALDLAGIDPSWVTEEGGLRLRPDYWPDLGGMDGFYCAVLRRTA
ncbi:RsmB/NOP family class I SAM-dependent RNA methyltransferase [Pseudooceanicola sp. C21-150M6]|uniref:RsmB/NOP family class I SAM-dependent RNA methyltransferase n=1 Tax=Pseudooceanicola sp. C21-150M6 TaxID=3434355 RepID=UPI003D7FE83C